MIFKICAVYDQATQSYQNQPMFVHHTGHAVRGFIDECKSKDGQSSVAAHPADFDLWLIGEYDTDSGRITQEDNQRLVRGKDVIEQK